MFYAKLEKRRRGDDEIPDGNIKCVNFLMNGRANERYCTCRGPDRTTIRIGVRRTQLLVELHYSLNVVDLSDSLTRTTVIPQEMRQSCSWHFRGASRIVRLVLGFLLARQAGSNLDWHSVSERSKDMSTKTSFLGHTRRRHETG